MSNNIDKLTDRERKLLYDQQYRESYFNPTFKGFLKRYPNISILKVGWALYWRLFIMMTGIYIALAIIIILLDS